MMWMMGYSDAGEFDTIQDPFTGRKLRPLVPRPAAAAASTNPPACLTPIHSTDLLALNHHLAMAAEHKRDLTHTQQVVVSSRWNPTPEQLQTLEELYRSGTRTPSADQIQHITAQLRKYGKIEGKNVFYWFQNHKARERQKRRRQQLESLSDEPQIANSNHDTQNGEKKELTPGSNKTAFEVEQTKNWASPTNSSTVAEKTVCKQGGAAEAGEAECKAASASAAAAVDGGGGGGGWSQLDIDVADLYQRRNATWQMMHLSCSSSSPTNLIMPSSSSSALTVTSPIIIPSKHQQQQQQHTHLHPHHQLDFVNIFAKPYNSTHHHILHDHHLVSPSCEGVAQTLQLFPLESTGGLSNRCASSQEEEEDAGIGMNLAADHVAPFQFFEFLPLKN